jgi:hypothetical protein
MPRSGTRLARRRWLGRALRTGRALLGMTVLAACGPAGAGLGRGTAAHTTGRSTARSVSALPAVATATPAPPSSPTATATLAASATPTRAPAVTATALPSRSAAASPVGAGQAETTVANCALPPLPGAFLGLDDRALPGPQGATDQAQVIRFQPGQPACVLQKGLPPRNQGGLTASPDGRLVAFGRDQDRSPGNWRRPDEQGLWIMAMDGSTPRRLVQAPASPVGNFLTIGPLAWSPDGKTLAYSVQPLGSGTRCPDPAAGGIWLTAVDHPQPRRLATAAQLGTLQPAPPAGMGCALFLSRLSWSPDGRRLAVSTARPKPGSSQPGAIEPVVLAVDTGNGAATALVVGGSDAAFAPRSGRLAYATQVYPTAKAPARTTLWVADAQGKQARALVSQEAFIHNVAWSPDGHFLAFLGNAAGPRRGWTLQVIDVDTETLCTVMTTGQWQQAPFLPGGSLDRLAWVASS